MKMNPGFAFILFVVCFFMFGGIWLIFGEVFQSYDQNISRIEEGNAFPALRTLILFIIGIVPIIIIIALFLYYGLNSNQQGGPYQ
jgi:ABC-type uncharacterized transport system YnjBCD permease subunit